jgi:antitoxin (DNA-binding transcriptional repressor) of toxin-antitoxin stability system
MTRFFAVPVALLAAALPAFGQDDLQKLKQEIEAQKAYIETLTRRLGDLERERSAQAPRAVEAPKAAPSATTSPPGGARQAAAEALARLALAPRRPLQGKVSAVAVEIGLVVLSLGTEDGVREGEEFTVYRDGDFVAKIGVDRADRKWSAGKITLKKSDPRVGDDVSNHLLVSTRVAAASAPLKSAEALRDLRRELDEIRKQVRELSGQLYPAWAVAGVYVEEAPEELREHLGMSHGVVVKAVRAGSAAEKAGLRVHDAVPRLTETQVLEAIEKGDPIGIVRQGKAQTVGGR